jgi:hypothetical protein
MLSRSTRRYGAILIRLKWRIRLYFWRAIWGAALRAILFLWMLDFTSWASENDVNPAGFLFARVYDDTGRSACATKAAAFHCSVQQRAISAGDF